MEKKYAKIVAASFAKVGTQTVDRSLKEKDTFIKKYRVGGKI